MAALLWERVTPHVMRCRLPFCDVTVGVVHNNGVALVVDTGTTLAEARAVAHDIAERTGSAVRHVVLTHHHFDHVLGHSVFSGARTYCSADVVQTMADRKALLRADAVVELGGDVVVTITHPGRGHTGHDLIAVVADGDRTAVFCGDLVEESADPCIDEHSDLDAWPVTLARVLDAGGESAAYIPGHGAVVDAAYVRRQADWLARQSS